MKGGLLSSHSTNHFLFFFQIFYYVKIVLVYCLDNVWHMMVNDSRIIFLCIDNVLEEEGKYKKPIKGKGAIG